MAVAIPAIVSLLSTFGPMLLDKFGSKKEQFKKLPNYNPGQEDVLNAQSEGLKGLTPDVFKWLQSLYSQDSQSQQAFAAPHMRQFNEQIVPGIAEQFGGVGALSSSGFQNALGSASAGLSERLAALQQDTRLSGLNAFQGLSGQNLSAQPFSYKQRGPSFSESLAPSLGKTSGKAGGDSIQQLLKSLGWGG